MNVCLLWMVIWVEYVTIFISWENELPSTFVEHDVREYVIFVAASSPRVQSKVSPVLTSYRNASH